LSIQKAIEIEVDLVEFDIRFTNDNIPVVIHDETIDRTSDGNGYVKDFSYEEVSKFNYSFWEGPEDTGKRLKHKKYQETKIPTFKEVLDAANLSVGLNMHVAPFESKEIAVILCSFYEAYNLCGRGYFSVGTFEEAKLIREVNDLVELCVLEGQIDMRLATLERLCQFGCRIIQPFHDCVTPELCQLINKMQLNANMFYANTEEDAKRFISYGMKGILTDDPMMLKKTINEMGLK
jgi:glycerophosphoryl diester phosphodiesterase